MSGNIPWRNRGGKTDSGKAPGSGSGSGSSGNKGKGKAPQKDPVGTLIFNPTLKSRSNGAQLTVLTNHFPLRSLPDASTSIYQYGISLKLLKQQGKSTGGTDSEVPRPMVMKKAWTALEELGWFGSKDGHATVWDGESTIWSTKLLAEKELLSLPNLLNLPGHTQARPNQLHITIELQKTLDIPSLVSYVTTSKSAGTVYDPPADTLFDCFRWLMAAFRDGPANRMISFPRSTTFFSEDRSEGMALSLPKTACLEVRRGLEQRVTFAFNALSINVHTKCGIFRQPRKSLFAVAMLSSRPRAEDLRWLVGLKFVMHYGGKHKDSRTKRVHRISARNASNCFFDHEGKNVSVKQYFKTKYNITLSQPTLPLLETAKGEQMPAELAFTSIDEIVKREQLKEQASSEFVKFASRMPVEKRQDIRNCISLLNEWKDTKLSRFGLEVSTSMMEVGALKLPAPELFFHIGNASKRRDIPSSGQWDLRGKRFAQVGDFGSCGGIAYVASAERSDPNIIQVIHEFGVELTNTCWNHGMLAPDKWCPRVLATTEAGITVVEDGKLRFSDGFKNLFQQVRPKFVIFVIHRGSEETYRKIKHVADTLGIVSQCVQAEKLTKKGGTSGQYRSNLALKINSKLGGFNWAVDTRCFAKLTDVMVIAADVVHPSPAPADRKVDQISPSIAVLVGSTDRACVKYVAEETQQDVRQEVISKSNMEIMFASILKRYQKLNGGKYPKHVLFLRDGVSDSQVAALVENEVAALKTVRNSFTASNKGQKLFNITSINCVKRHHTRFFPKTATDNNNVECGTVVEASLDTNDFFLVAHNSPLGTSRPTRYTMVDDENGLQIGQFEAIVQQGCFGFQRATKSIALHAAVKHADRCAERARARLRLNASGQMVLFPIAESLKDSMYWL